MMKHTIAIVGLGAAAQRIHIPAYSGIGNLQIVGAADATPTNHSFAFPVFASLEQLLTRAKPDIVTIATPPRSHFELARLALEAGCHVFCEKPFMNSLKEVDEIIALSERVGRRVAVNNEFRFMECHVAARQKIGSPEFGSLLFATMNQTFFVTRETEAGWRGEDIHRTVKDFGTHALDLCRYFFDEDPISVSAQMPNGPRSNRPDFLSLIQLEFSGDRVANITLDRLSRGPHRYLDIRLDGDHGCVETSLGGKFDVSFGIRAATRRPFLLFDRAMGGRARLYHGEKFTLLATDPLNLFAHATKRLMQAFLVALEKGTSVPCDARDNRRTLALMLAAYEADAHRAPVRMRYEPLPSSLHTNPA